MAKYETRLRGDFDETLRDLHDGILDKSASASFEDESYVQCAGVRCCVRVYERYSWSGGNRPVHDPHFGWGWGGTVSVCYHRRRQPGDVLEVQYLGGGVFPGYPPGVVERHPSVL